MGKVLEKGSPIDLFAKSQGGDGGPKAIDG